MQPLELNNEHRDAILDAADRIIASDIAWVELVVVPEGADPKTVDQSDLNPSDDDALGPGLAAVVPTIPGVPGAQVLIYTDGDHVEMRHLAGDPVDADLACAVVGRAINRPIKIDRKPGPLAASLKLIDPANDNTSQQDREEAAQLVKDHGSPESYIQENRVYGLTIEGRKGVAIKLRGAWFFEDARTARMTRLVMDASSGPKLVSSAELVRGFTPPDYHIEGVIQRGYLYSMTASTGTGKTAVALLITLLTEQGEDLGAREVTQGRVVYFAGENQDDVTMRWIGMCHERGLDPDVLDVHFIRERFSIPEAISAIREQVEALGGAGLVIVDTSAAYFQGDDENGNTALGAHARDIRELTKLPGRPCVVVLCHPTKNAANDNILPRGGGAFLAQVDGNLTLTRSDEAVRLHWQGKHRGVDFKPISFGLKSVTAPQLIDSKGRPVPTVMAVLIGDDELRETCQQQRRDEDEALVLIQNGKKSYSEIAEAAGWKDKNRETHKRRAQTACEKLKASKLAEYKDRVGWRLTKDGEDAAQAVRAEMHRMDAAKASIRNMIGDDDD